MAEVKKLLFCQASKLLGKLCYTTVLGPTPEFLIQWVWGGAKN